MQPRVLDAAQHPQPKAWALTLLADILRVGPPKLSEIISCLEGIDNVKEFVSLVQMLLPEYEKEIMAAPRNRRVYQFCYRFGMKYYPLPANTDCPPADWVEGIPVELLGMSYTAYHDLEMRPGYMMLLSLIVYPFEGDERDGEDDDVPYDPFDPLKKMNTELANEAYKPNKADMKWLRDLLDLLKIGGEWIAPAGFKISKLTENTIEIKVIDDNYKAKELVRRTIMVAEKMHIEVKSSRKGRTARQKINGARVPLLDAIKRYIGDEMAGKIPSTGWTPEELHKMTDGTVYDGVGIYADWACSQTGCITLDSNYEDCNYVEGDGAPTFAWTVENVNMLTQDYPKAQDIRNKMDKIVGWLEQNPTMNFTGLLNHLLRESEKLPIKPRKVHVFRDPEEHFIPLKQAGLEEDGEENES